jgi:hypothetical protein
MVIKHALRRTAPDEVPNSKALAKSSAEADINENLAESEPCNPVDSKSGSLMNTVEHLSKAIEHLSVKKSSWRSTVLTHLAFPLLLVVATGIVGAYLTDRYTRRQKDVDHARSEQQLLLASQRSFSDELNKQRIPKIGEVWERIDSNEVLLDNLWDKADKASDSNNQNVEAINALIQEDRVITNKNRFWLGQQHYNEIQSYLDKNVQLALNMLLARPGADLGAIVEERKNLKKDIITIKESMLSEGRPGK